MSNQTFSLPKKPNKLYINSTICQLTDLISIKLKHHSILWKQTNRNNDRQMYMMYRCYILTIFYILSKYIKLYAIKKVTSRAIIEKITKDYIPEVEKPEEILTDNGTQFCRNCGQQKCWNLTSKLTSHLGSTHKRTKWNGITEKLEGFYGPTVRIRLQSVQTIKC